MRDLNQRFYTNIPGLQQSLYNTAVKQGYFGASPSAVRSHYGCLGGFLLVAAIVGGLVLAVAASEAGPAPLHVPIHGGRGGGSSSCCGLAGTCP